MESNEESIRSALQRQKADLYLQALNALLMRYDRIVIEATKQGFTVTEIDAERVVGGKRIAYRRCQVEYAITRTLNQLEENEDEIIG